MDALISLPLLSFFALPALSNYSTTLNLALFTMTWMTLTLSHTPLNIELYGTLAVRFAFYLLPSAFFLLFDTAVPSLAVTIKAHGDVALPARKGRQKVANVVAVSMANVVLGVLLQVAIELLFTELLRVRSALKIAKTVPLPWAIAKHLALGMLVRNVLQYYIHRFVLHSRKSRIAGWHKSWHHSIRAPWSFVANYDHPVAWLVGRWLPVYLPAAVFHFHILTYYILLALISLEETFTFSGSSILPSTILLRGMARRQDVHLLSGGKGNFAPFGILDWVHGTSVGGEDAVDDLRKEAKKRDVRGKTNSAIEGTGKFLDDAGTKLRNGKRRSSRK